MSGTVGRTLFQLGFQISPIILVNGLAIGMPGAMLPIVVLTEAVNFIQGLLAGGTTLSLDNFFAQFEPLPGSRLISQTVGKYPLANQQVAANAVIAQPLNVSMRMLCPVRQPGGWITKLATLTALQTALAAHNASGGTYIVATPAQIWTNGLLTAVEDISSGRGSQTQTEFRFDFEFPLITQAQAQSVLGGLMSRISGGLPTDGSLSGGASTAGNALSGGTAATVPAATNLPGTSVTPGFQSAAPVPVTASPL